MQKTIANLPQRAKFSRWGDFFVVIINKSETFTEKDYKNSVLKYITVFYERIFVMYVFKNALKCIGRSKGRNILIGVIVFIIALSACIGLSIRQAADSAREETLKTLKITANISFDRSSMMSDMRGEGGKGSFDRDKFSENMEKMSGLTLEEYQKYAKAETVEDFYYTVTTSVNGTENFSSVTTETEDESSQSDNSGMPQMPNGGFGGSFDGGFMGGFGKGGIGGGMQGDFTITGYSSEKAMTTFIDGTAAIKEGEVFAEGTENYDCIIPSELAEFNSLSVGDSVKIANPNNEEEIYTLKVVGIYTDSSANESGTGFMGMTANDPANQILVSYNALTKIIAASEKNATTETDEETGRESSTKLNGQLNGSYVFADVDAYEQFKKDVAEMGLDENYTVSSNDIESFENSLVPLNTLGDLAGYFLLVILIIGAVILVVLNIFNVRERKYEIGVLTAMGMKKGKVALQFITEIFVVTIVAVIIGAGIGAVGSVPVTNALLENQVASQSNQSDRIEESFGRFPGGEQGGMPQMQTPPDGDSGFNPFESLMGINNENAYVTEITSATNFTVLLQMLGIGVLLTLVSGAVSMLFIMRYEPLKILANRD